MQTDGQDMMQLICTFCDFANVSQRINSVFYASTFVLTNNHHIKVVPRILEGYEVTGKTRK
jgi:hypothetical protein